MSDYSKFLNPNALKGAHIAVPMHPYWIEFGLGAARTALMNDAIATMTSLGATVETCEIPSQAVLIVPGGFFLNPAAGLPAGFNAKTSPFIERSAPAFGYQSLKVVAPLPEVKTIDCAFRSGLRACQCRSSACSTSSPDFAPK